MNATKVATGPYADTPLSISSRLMPVTGASPTAPRPNARTRRPGGTARRSSPLLDRQLADRQDQQLHHDYGEILGIPVTGDRRQRQRTLIAHTGASIESSRTHLPRPNSFSLAHSIP